MGLKYKTRPRLYNQIIRSRHGRLTAAVLHYYCTTCVLVYARIHKECARRMGLVTIVTDAM